MIEYPRTELLHQCSCATAYMARHSPLREALNENKRESCKNETRMSHAGRCTRAAVPIQ